ncbi:hypothetical protein M2405_004000 [Rhodococcus erythropolis]|uniref:hypothetical protein n=1 Tax=Rhodococcus erythropolis TaxID=1833 RepID=UPI002167AF37|nr:hypothetical protein [Rhodococcus erythropolis]MCS4255697.1 hypothetical protein [Rhodococcus erythropolis]MCW2425210.1 hypothetical protein [Rhodococcus erythropolis]
MIAAEITGTFSHADVVDAVVDDLIAPIRHARPYAEVGDTVEHPAVVVCSGFAVVACSTCATRLRPPEDHVTPTMSFPT